jgi:hypothetical protein
MTYNLPDTSFRTQVFYQSGNWIKPQGISMVYVTLIGGGGGGGGGQSTASGVAGNGGGGGGTGTISKVMISADLLEDRLRVTVGRGGAGGVPNGDGVVGSESRVEGITVFLSTIMIAGGSSTQGLSSGGGGSGGQATTLQTANLASMGIFISNAGGAGGSSGLPNITYGSLPAAGPLSITPGCGGGTKTVSNTSTNGGSIIGSGVVPNFSGGTSGGTNGISSQINSLSPLIFLGGTGGGGNGTGTGGNGGDGGLGCGGGGGGAGITGGSGGRGGNGLVIINCW